MNTLLEISSIICISGAFVMCISGIAMTCFAFVDYFFSTKLHVFSLYLLAVGIAIFLISLCLKLMYVALWIYQYVPCC